MVGSEYFRYDELSANLRCLLKHLFALLIPGRVDARRASRIDPHYEHTLIFMLTDMRLSSY
jgi:hypothetical protein